MKNMPAALIPPVPLWRENYVFMVSDGAHWRLIMVPLSSHYSRLACIEAALNVAIGEPSFKAGGVRQIHARRESSDPSVKE
jgi:hypothetical protein